MNANIGYSFKPGKKVLLSTKTDHMQTARFIDEISSMASKRPLCQKVAEALKKTKHPEKTLFKWMRQKVGFKPEIMEQTIKTPERLLLVDPKSTRFGNCVDFTAGISSFLKAAKIPHVYRMTSHDGNKTPHHIYIITPAGAMDLNQGRSVRDPWNQTNYFGCETPYTSKKDYKPIFL